MVAITEAIEHFNAGAGVVLNCLLLYAIRRFSRLSIGSYKYLLAVFAAFDVFLTILHAVVKPRVIIIDGMFGIVSEEFENWVIIGVYVSCFTVPFALMIIHFLYRFWCIRFKHLIHLFSNPKFVGLLSLYPLAQFCAWFVICVIVPTGRGPEIGRTILRAESFRRLGHEIRDGWLIVNFWEYNKLNLRGFLGLVTVDLIMLFSSSVAITLGCLTFHHIKRADKISTAANNLQWLLFIAVCAQTFVPLVFVYLPYATVLNFGFFRLPVFFVDDAFKFLTSCFPVWDAVVIIMLMSDYRLGLLGILRKKKNAVMEISIQTTSVVPSTMDFSLESTVVFIHICVATVSISLNLLLSFIIFHYTPQAFSTFGILIKLHVLADLYTAIGCASAMQRAIPVEWQLLYISYGPCGFLSTKACFLSCAMMFGGETLAVYTILTSFIYRLLVIEGKKLSTANAVGLICGIAMPIPTILTILFLVSRVGDESARYLMNRYFPAYHADKHVVTGHCDMRNGIMMTGFVLLAVLSWPVYVCTLYIRRRILASLHLQSFMLSAKSRQLHQRFVSMLTAQAALPILPAIGISTFFIAFFDVYHHPVLESSTFLTGEITTIISPLIVVFFIDHYRKALLNVFHCRPISIVSKISHSPSSISSR